MNICVTGGAGFIGSHLVDTLIEQGHCVVIIDNLSTGCREFVNTQAHFFEMDIRDKDILKIFQTYKFDYVFHEAAQTMVDVSMRDPILDCEVNLVGLVNILEACRKTGVKKIIMPSSAAVYGDLDTLPLKETMQGKPSSFYGLTKMTTESYLDLYYKNFNLPYICLRYANVYGPRQGNGGEGGVVSIFCKILTEGRHISIFGDGLQTRDFVYVHDVVAANIACLEQESVVGVYNVSTNVTLSINDLAKKLIRIAQKDVKIIHSAERLGDIKHSCLDTAKSKKDLAWTAVMPIDEGLQKTYNYFVKNK